MVPRGDASALLTSPRIDAVGDQLSGLDFLWLELTGKCNLRCVHCYADSGPEAPLHERMRIADWRKALAEASAVGCRKVQFIGGEATLYPNLVELIEDAHRLGFEHIEVFTNGTAFTERLRAHLLKRNVKLAFSVYSANAEHHEAVTMRAGSFEKTIASLRWALSAGLSVRVAVIDTCADPCNAENTVQYLRELGVETVQVDRVRGVGRGGGARPAEDVIDELCGRCWQGKLCVTPSGAVFPCVFSRASPIGGFEEGLSSLLQGSPLRRFREDVRSRFAKGAEGCNPQCGPDCAPATCGPQSCKPTG